MIEELVKRYPVLESVKGQIEDAYKILETCYENGGKLLIAGNGGSAADSDHIVGELMKGFVKRRPVSTELAEALKQADPERGEELAKKLQGGLPASHRPHKSYGSLLRIRKRCGWNALLRTAGKRLRKSRGCVPRNQHLRKL